jgi:hypothetical protein
MAGATAIKEQRKSRSRTRNNPLYVKNISADQSVRTDVVAPRNNVFCFADQRKLNAPEGARNNEKPVGRTTS